MLSEEDRRRIEAEEAYRHEIRSQYVKPESGGIARQHVVLAVISTAVVVSGLFVLLSQTKESSSPRTNATAPAKVQGLLDSLPFTKPTPRFRMVSTGKAIMNGAVTVKALSTLHYRIRISNDMINARIKGGFRAMGGGGNDVEAILADEPGYTNWLNGHQAQNYWNSGGRVTVGSLDVRGLAPGEYYLAFGNKFSLLTDKQLFADIGLEWESVVAYAEPPGALSEEELAVAQQGEVLRLQKRRMRD